MLIVAVDRGCCFGFAAMDFETMLEELFELAMQFVGTVFLLSLEEFLLVKVPVFAKTLLALSSVAWVPFCATVVAMSALLALTPTLILLFLEEDFSCEDCKTFDLVLDIRVLFAEGACWEGFPEDGPTPCLVGPFDGLLATLLLLTSEALLRDCPSFLAFAATPETLQSSPI